MPAYRFDEDEQVLYFIDLHGLTRLAPDGLRTLTHATSGRCTLSEIEARDALGDQAIPGGAVGLDVLRGHSGSLDIAGESLLVQYNARLEEYPDRIERISLPQLRVDRRAGDLFGMPSDIHFFSGDQTIAYVQRGELVVAHWRALAPEYVEVEDPVAGVGALILKEREPSRITGFYLHDHAQRNLPEIRFGNTISTHRPDAGSPTHRQKRTIDEALTRLGAEGLTIHLEGPEPLTSRFRLSPDGAFAFFDGAEHRLYFGRLTMDDFLVHWQAPVSIECDLLTIAPANNGLFVSAQLGGHIDGFFIQPDGSLKRFTWEGIGLPERTCDSVVYQVAETPNEAVKLIWCDLLDGHIERCASVEVKRRVGGNRALPLSGAGQIILGRTRTLWLPWHGLSIFDLDAEREISRRLGGKSRLLRLYFASRGTPHAALVDAWIHQAVTKYIVRKADDITDRSYEAIVLGGQVYCWDDDAPLANWLSTAVQTAWRLFQDGCVRSIQLAGGPAECAFMSDQLERLGYPWPDQFNPAQPTYAMMQQCRKDRIILCGPMPDLARRVFLARAANVDAIGFDTSADSGSARLKGS